MSDHAAPSKENRVPQDTLLEQILEQANVQKAWERVRANKGAAGIDKMSISQFPAFASDHLSRILGLIREGRYAPAAVRRVWIPKPNGEKRPLGIPTVLDRVIQQAMAQVLNPIFDVDFSDSSYGFRYGRQAHAAIEHVSEASQDGYKWGVDCDLKAYFDTLNHDLLIHQMKQKVKDKRVLRLVGKYLRAGIRHEDGTTEKTLKGVPQGGPLSPLLANIMLDPLDKMIEEMQLPFARYADDFIVMTKTKAEAVLVMARVKDFIECRLRLLVNQDKSKVAKLKDCSFLGFQVHGKKIRRTEKAVQRFKSRICEITARSRGCSVRQRLAELKRYCLGWFHYFKYGLSYNEVIRWDQWIRRRVRLCYWKDWKLPRKRRRMLLKLGVPRVRVKLASRSRKGYWRMAGNSIVQLALNDSFLMDQGVPSLRGLWVSYKYKDQTNP